MTTFIAKLVFCWTLLFCAVASAGDLSCYGKTSTTNHFACTSVGNCTWWAAYKRPDLAAEVSGSGWNGGQWYDKFQSKGFSVGSGPKPGSIVEFSSPGHVAYVEKVRSDGSFDVSEMDSTGLLGSGGVYYATYYPSGNGKYQRNNGAPGGWTLRGFIYPKGTASATSTTCDPTKQKCDIRVKGAIGWFPSVSVCQNATQWFIIGTNANGERYPVGSRPDASACPLACYAN